MALVGELSAAPDFTYPEDVFPELQPLLQDAVTNSSRIAALREQVAQGRGEAESAASGAYPQLRAYFDISQGYEYRRDIDSRWRNAGRLGVQANQPIWQWGAISAQRRLGERRLTQSQANLVNSGGEALRGLREAYLRWRLAIQQEAILAENIDLAAQFVANQQKLQAAGVEAEQSVLEMQSRLESERELLALVRRDVVRFRNLLRILTGNEAFQADAGKPFPRFDLPQASEVEHLRAQVLAEPDTNPAVRLRQESVEVEREYYRVVSKNQYPRLDLIAGSYSDEVDSYNSADQTYRIYSYVGLSVNWNIFDGGRTRGEKMSALARKRRAEYELKEAREGVVSERERFLAEIEFNLAQARSRALRVQLLERRLGLVERQLEASYVSPIDRLQLRLDLLEARQGEYESRVSYLLSMQQLAALHEADPIHLPEKAP